MVKNKDSVIILQILCVFLIPLTPHLTITDNLQFDDIPVALFLLLFALNLYNKKIIFFKIKEFLPLSMFIFYITFQNYLINGKLIFSDNIRFTFYLVLMITILSVKNLDFLKSFYFYLTVFLSIFSISFYIFKIELGIDSYDYWSIGFNQNDWLFTPGRMNGFQAGGPNAFGGLIACLTIYTASSLENIKKYFIIFIGILGCFFTYSRASILVLILSLLFVLIFKKDFIGLFVSAIALLITLNFGLVDRFTSENETDGIQDRIEMQNASISDILNKSISDNLIGYGQGNFGIVRDELSSIDEFSNDVRPTGPHNSFLFLILNYGFIGLFLFLNIFIKPLKIFFTKFSNNLINPNYLFLGSFVALSFTGDFIQNHSISVLFFLLLFESLREEENAK
tara:strand:+ start:3052 stop:4236 length:1185 start_codon:yes stop_codon:yes gene_type:complete